MLVFGLCLLGFTADAKEPSKEDSVVLSKEAIMKIQAFIQNQQQQIAAEHEMSEYWHEKYQNARSCVAKSENHYQAITCVGIVTASNANK